VPNWLRPATIAWSVVVLGSVVAVTVNDTAPPLGMVPYAVAAVTAVWVMVVLVVSSRRRAALLDAPAAVVSPSQLARLDAIPISLPGHAHGPWGVQARDIDAGRELGAHTDPDEAVAVARALRGRLVIGTAVGQRDRR
jgi:hypothetical protein